MVKYSVCPHQWQVMGAIMSNNMITCSRSLLHGSSILKGFHVLEVLHRTLCQDTCGIFRSCKRYSTCMEHQAR